MEEHNQNLEFLNNYFNENININNINNLANNRNIEKYTNAIFNCVYIIFAISITQWIFKSLYFYFCYDPSYMGIFTNLLTIYNPVCYWLNWSQWKISESLVIITISLLISSGSNLLQLFQNNIPQNNTHENNNENNNEDIDPQ